MTIYYGYEEPNGLGGIAATGIDVDLLALMNQPILIENVVTNQVSNNGLTITGFISTSAYTMFTYTGTTTPVAGQQITIGGFTGAFSALNGTSTISLAPSTYPSPATVACTGVTAGSYINNYYVPQSWLSVIQIPGAVQALNCSTDTNDSVPLLLGQITYNSNGINNIWEFNVNQGTAPNGNPYYVPQKNPSGSGTATALNWFAVPKTSNLGAGVVNGTTITTAGGSVSCGNISASITLVTLDGYGRHFVNSSGNSSSTVEYGAATQYLCRLEYQTKVLATINGRDLVSSGRAYLNGFYLGISTESRVTLPNVTNPAQEHPIIMYVENNYDENGLTGYNTVLHFE
jgi:hypothetical protein